MAIISFAGATETQITVNISHSGSVVNKYNLYCDGSLFSTDTFPNTTSHSAQRTKPGLTAGSSHGFSVYYYRGTTLVSSDSGRWSTKSPPQPAPGSISGLNVSVSGFAPATATASWNTPTGSPTGYNWEFSGPVNRTGTTGSTSVSTSGLPSGSYTFFVSAFNGVGTGPTASRSFTVSAQPPPPPVGSPSPVTFTQVDLLGYQIFWNSVSGATSYEVTAQGSAGEFLKATTSSLNAVISLDNYGTSYTIRVKPKNSGGYGSTGTATIITNEHTPPTATITLTPDPTDVLVSWSIVDNPGPGETAASGFWHMKINISVPGNSTTFLVSDTTTNPGSFAFTTDGAGNPILPNTQYRFYFQIYDRDANELIVDRFVTTPAPTRPSNFAWTTAKVSGQIFNLTVSEWTNLANKVQAFRAYKGLTNYSFGDTGIPGFAFTAVHFNEMRAAIAGMSPPTSPPGSVTTGSTVFAAQLNGLRDSLNSIP